MIFKRSIKNEVEYTKIKSLPEEVRKELDDKLRIVDGIIGDIRATLQ